MFLCLFLIVSQIARLLPFEDQGIFLLLRTVKALLICHIVDEQDTHRAAVVGGGDGSKTFLAGSVPYLQFHALAVQVDGADLKIYPDGCDETWCEAVFAEP